MIASALRTEIQQYLAADRDHVADASLARLALGALERDSDEAPATLLACQALCESLTARFEGQSLDRFEATLDAIDDLVKDPAELSGLRASLLHFIEQLDRLCKEATRAPRRQPEHHVSAA